MTYLLARMTSVVTLFLSIGLVIGSFANDSLIMLRWSVAMSIVSTATGMLTINSDVVDLGKEVDELYKEEEE